MESSLLRDFKNLLISTVDDSNIIEGKDDNSNNIDKIRLESSYFEPEMNLVNIRTKSSTSRSETHGVEHPDWDFMIVLLLGSKIISFNERLSYLQQNLPILSSISNAIMSTWLSTKDLANLDSAVCNKKQRPFFLRMVSADNFISYGFPALANERYFQWLSRRGIMVRQLNLRLFRRLCFCCSNCNVRLSSSALLHVQRIQRYNAASASESEPIEYLEMSFDPVVTPAVISASKGAVRILSLWDSPQLTDFSLVSLLRSLPRTWLSSLDLSACDSLTSAAVDYLADHFCRKGGDQNKSYPGLQLLNLGECVSAVGDSGLCKLAKGASAPLLFLNLGYCDRVSDVGLSTVLLSCPSLRSLNIEFCRLISDKGVAPIARPGCALLEELIISGCTSITEQGLCLVVANQPMLYRLVARHSSAVTDSAVIAIAQHCSQLEDLDVSYPSRLLCTGQELHSMELLDHERDADLAQLLLQQSPTRPTSISSLYSLGDISLCVLADRCGRTLRSLRLRGCERVSDRSIWAFRHHCSQLHSLDVSELPRISALSMSLLPGSLHQLSLFRCAEIADVEQVALFMLKRRTELAQNGEMVGSLRSLHLVHRTAAVRTIDERISDNELEKEHKIPVRMRSHVRQRHRRRRRRFYVDDNNEVDDAGESEDDVDPRDSGLWTLSLEAQGQKGSSLHLNTVADELPLPLREAAIELLLQQEILSLSPAQTQAPVSVLLESLVLKNQLQMSDQGLLRALSGGVSQGLRLLNVSGCRSLSDRSLTKIGGGSVGGANLTSVNISGCVFVSDAVILSLCSNCLQLCHLNLSGCVRITDSSIESLSGPSSVCRASLRSLDASYCTQLSDRSCLAIAAEEGCCFIDRLALAGCSRVSDAGILAIAGQCPYLLYFNSRSVSSGSVGVRSGKDPVTAAFSPTLELLDPLEMRRQRQVRWSLKRMDVRYCRNISPSYASIAQLLLACPLLEAVLYGEDFAMHRDGRG